MSLSDHPLYIASFALLLACAPGLGRLVLGRCVGGRLWTTALAQALLGALILIDLFSLGLQLAVPRTIALAVLGCLSVLGSLAWISALIRERELRPARFGVWAVGVALLVIASWLPVDPNSTDSVFYAFMTSTALEPDWVNSNLAGSAAAQVAGTNASFAASRGAAVGVLWPWVALGWGLNARIVAEVCQWLLAVGVVLVANVLDRDPPVARWLLAAGAMAAFSEEAAQGGQIGQTFGVVTVVVAVWAERHVASGWARALFMALAGFGVATGYTELLAALPAYIACLCLWQPRGWRAVASSSTAMLCGVLVAELATRGATLNELLVQSQSAPGARALGETVASPADVWRWVLLERPFSRWLWVLLVPVLAYVALLARGKVRLECRRLCTPGTIAVVCALGWLGVLTWAALRSGNPEYATFKLGGWLGPAIMLGTWSVALAMPERVYRLAAAAVALLAGYRTIGLAWAGASLTVANLAATAPVAEWQETVRSDGVCEVQIAKPTASIVEVEAALAASAAARRGCAVRGA